jgi:signal peptidase I
VHTSAEVAVAMASAMALAWAVHRWLGFVIAVESVSMAPTLAPGQRLLARRRRATRPHRRGDVVVVDSVEVGRPVIKRVVGLPGEHIDVGADGRTRVGGHVLDEPYVVHGGGRPAAFEVPAGHVLLLGDNRAGSNDSRVWREPYLPVSAILGRVVPVGWSSAAAGPGPGSPRCAAAPTG